MLKVGEVNSIKSLYTMLCNRNMFYPNRIVISVQIERNHDQNYPIQIKNICHFVFGDLNIIEEENCPKYSAKNREIYIL